MMIPEGIGLRTIHSSYPSFRRGVTHPPSQMKSKCHKQMFETLVTRQTDKLSTRVQVFLLLTKINQKIHFLGLILIFKRLENTKVE